MSDFVTLGESMALLGAERVGRLRDMDRLGFSFGGAESNVAIGVRRLGHGATWIGRVGADEFGGKILATLRAEGVDTSHVVVDPDAQTALMFKEHRGPGLVRVTYYRRGFAGSRLTLSDVDPAVIASARVLHVTGITPALSASARDAVFAAVEAASAANVPVSFDVNYRSALWAPEVAAPCCADLAARADVVFGSEDELEMVLGDDDVLAAARRHVDAHGGSVVVKRGARGATEVGPETKIDATPPRVVALDPVGAGDAFVAGYLTGMLDGLDVADRLGLGCAAGARVASMPGDWQGLPDRDDLASLDREVGTTLR